MLLQRMNSLHYKFCSIAFKPKFKLVNINAMATMILTFLKMLAIKFQEPRENVSSGIGCKSHDEKLTEIDEITSTNGA